jgi:hypothetical protein
MPKRITLTPAQTEYYEAILQLVRELRARERELRAIRERQRALTTRNQL